MVYLFLAEGFEEAEALFPLDLLRRAGVEVTTVGVGGKQITGSHGITVAVDIPDRKFRLFALEHDIDAVILPGGMPGTRNLDASPIVDAALGVADGKGALICAICAAPSVLGKRGLLKGRRCTCYPGFEETLEGALEVGGAVIRDGNIITARGAGVAMEFGLEIVSVLKSPEEAGKIRASIQAL